MASSLADGDKGSFRKKNSQRRGGSAATDLDLHDEVGVSRQHDDVFSEIPVVEAVTVEAFYQDATATTSSSSSSSSPKRREEGAQAALSSSSMEREKDKERERSKKGSSGRNKRGGGGGDEQISLSEQLAATHVDRHQNGSHVWPAALRNDVVKSFSRKADEETGTAYLKQHHNWPNGMCKSILKGVRKIPIRFFIVDDSGSMSTNDGNRIVRAGAKNTKVIRCTRWAELVDALQFHAEFAEAAKAPTEFRLLNGADPVMVGLGNDNGEGLAFAKEVFTQDPAGHTPLCEHVNCVVAAIQSMASELKANGQKAAVIICTDGESTDGSIAEAMRPLQRLPVWVVVRLCTDENKVVNYW